MNSQGADVSYLAQLFLFAVMLAFPALAVSGLVEDAISKTYTPDGLLLGTIGPIMSEGRDAIFAHHLSSPHVLAKQ